MVVAKCVPSEHDSLSLDTDWLAAAHRAPRHALSDRTGQSNSGGRPQTPHTYISRCRAAAAAAASTSTSPLTIPVGLFVRGAPSLASPPPCRSATKTWKALLSTKVVRTSTSPTWVHRGHRGIGTERCGKGRTPTSRRACTTDSPTGMQRDGGSEGGSEEGRGGALFAAQHRTPRTSRRRPAQTLGPTRATIQFVTL